MDKWIVILVVGWFACLFIGMSVSEYLNHECRMAAIKADYTKEAIKELCQ